MRDHRISALLVGILLGACTSGDGTATTASPRPSAATSSPTQPAEPSAAPPNIGDLVDVHGEPIDVSSLEGRIVFSSGTEDVYIINADGSGLRRLTTSDDLEFDPTWSADGTAVAYRHQPDFDSPMHVFVMDADGSHRRDLTGSEELAGWGPDWSADGEWIAWNSATERTSYFDLGVIHPDGTGPHVIEAGIYVEYPAWSPDGSQIAFMSPGAGSPYDIYVMNADGSDVRDLTNAPGAEGWPAWSPDGRQIVFSTVWDDCGSSQAEDCLTTGDIGPWQTLYVMNADGTDQHRLSRTFGQFAVWSPDGRYILFAPWLNVIRPDGTGLARIAVEGTSAEPEMPDWIGA